MSEVEQRNEAILADVRALLGAGRKPDKATLLRAMRSLVELDDPETSHSFTDSLLLLWIDDPEIAEAYGADDKWFA